MSLSGPYSLSLSLSLFLSRAPRCDYAGVIVWCSFETPSAWYELEHVAQETEMEGKDKNLAFNHNTVYYYN